MEFIFTQEQTVKFMDAVGATGEAKAGVYTRQQLRELAENGGGLKDFPMHTSDPFVNYAVDCVVDEETPDEYDAKLYEADCVAMAG